MIERLFEDYIKRHIKPTTCVVRNTLLLNENVAEILENRTGKDISDKV